jgi:hypothetical protein
MTLAFAPEQVETWPLARLHPPQLFDLGTDPLHASVRAQCEALFCSLVDPEDVNRRARARQAEQPVLHGGRDRAASGRGVGIRWTPRSGGLDLGFGRRAAHHTSPTRGS